MRCASASPACLSSPIRCAWSRRCTRSRRRKSCNMVRALPPRCMADDGGIHLSKLQFSEEPKESRTVKRRGRDSNPRTLAGRRFSRPVVSAAHPPLRVAAGPPNRRPEAASLVPVFHCSGLGVHSCCHELTFVLRGPSSSSQRVLCLSRRQRVVRTVRSTARTAGRAYAFSPRILS